MNNFLNSEDINKSLEMWTICFQKLQFIITKCNTARLINLLQDYLILFMHFFVQFVKYFLHGAQLQSSGLLNLGCSETARRLTVRLAKHNLTNSGKQNEHHKVEGKLDVPKWYPRKIHFRTLVLGKLKSTSTEFEPNFCCTPMLYLLSYKVRLEASMGIRDR